MKTRTTCLFLTICLGWLALAGCRSGATPAGQATPTITPPTATYTPLEPSGTPIPSAATVNEQVITQAEFLAELARYQAAAGITDANALKAEDKERVLNDLIDQTLLAQAAAEMGFTADEAIIQQRMDNLAKELGSKEALDNWISTHGYDEASFRQALGRAAAAAWMRDQIIAAVPASAEQVHARQILLADAELANQTYALLQAGKDFATLAKENNPTTFGDLGWFPRGFLPYQEIEEAAFKLQPDEYSPVIQTRIGFHIIQVIERDPERPLDPEALLALQTEALHNWLKEHRSQSKIQVTF